jgi:hypothetical protein
MFGHLTAQDQMAQGGFDLGPKRKRLAPIGREQKVYHLLATDSLQRAGLHPDFLI